MKPKLQLHKIICLSLFVLSACSTQKYVFDSVSAKRQKELKHSRKSNVATGIVSGIISAFAATAFDTGLEWYPEDQQFKKLNLVNPTNDTIYVNMLTDVYWDEENYCDFMDIRIPPKKDCRIMVPVKTNYNLYFSNTPESNDDEMLEIYTSDIKKIFLKPGLTIINDTLNLNQ